MSSYAPTDAGAGSDPRSPLSRDFDVLWTGAVTFRQVSPQLRKLLFAVYREARREPANLLYLKQSLEEALEFLASSGRTDANCTVTDYFFSAAAPREKEWQHLPQPYRKIVGDLGGALHDTIHAPEIAETFDSLPEQLLRRVKAIA